MDCWLLARLCPSYATLTSSHRHIRWVLTQFLSFSLIQPRNLVLHAYTYASCSVSIGMCLWHTSGFILCCNNHATVSWFLSVCYKSICTPIQPSISPSLLPSVCTFMFGWIVFFLGCKSLFWSITKISLWNDAEHWRPIISVCEFCKYCSLQNGLIC